MLPPAQRRPKIEKGQVWENRSAVQFLVSHKKGDRWKLKVLTDRPGVYNGAHTFQEHIMYKKLLLLN
jgi:hypothetical protein